MPVSHERLALYQAVRPPAAPIVRARVRDYMDSTGLEPVDLAAEIGRCGRSSIDHFLAGTYAQVAATDKIIRARLWDYMERHPIVEGDSDVPARLLGTRDTRLILERIEQARQRGRIIVIEGPPGTSKTTALRRYWMQRNRSQKRDALYLRAWLGNSGPGLMRAFSRLAGASARGARDRLLGSTVRRLKERRPAVLLIDEAQHLLGNGAKAFEQLRDVLDLAGCGCLLAGHFNFVKALSNGLGRELEQWLSRIDLHEHLGGLTEEELSRVASDYLGAELPGDILEHLKRAALARDRNAALRSVAAGGKRLPIRYLSIRRVRKFFDRIEELRQIPGNEKARLPELARASLRLLMAPEGSAL